MNMLSVAENRGKSLQSIPLLVTLVTLPTVKLENTHFPRVAFVSGVSVHVKSSSLPQQIQTAQFINILKNIKLLAPGQKHDHFARAIFVLIVGGGREGSTVISCDFLFRCT